MILAAAALSVSYAQEQQKPKQPPPAKPPAQQDPVEVEPPEEDEALKPKEYTFNPLEAQRDAVRFVADPHLLRLSAEIMGAEAQHWTALSSMRHHGDVKMSVPYPFVGGST